MTQGSKSKPSVAVGKGQKSIVDPVENLDRGSKVASGRTKRTREPDPDDSDVAVPHQKKMQASCANKQEGALHKLDRTGNSSRLGDTGTSKTHGGSIASDGEEAKCVHNHDSNHFG